MSDQKHIIKRQVIELTVRDTKQARRLHDEVSRIYHQRIAPLIDQYGTELSPPDRIHRIARLELDLGTIDSRQLEADLVAKVSIALRQALAAQIGKQEPDAVCPDQSTEVMSQLELLALFARTGSLPWWVDAATPRPVENGLRHLLEHAPEVLRHLLHELAREQRPLPRIINHVTDDMLGALVGSLVPAIRPSLLAHLPALLTLLPRIPSAVGWTSASLRTSAWIALVRVASLAALRFTTPQPFYAAVLRRIAADLGTTYAALLAELHHAAQPSHAPRPPTLAGLLAELEQAHHATALARRLSQVADSGAALAGLLAELHALAPQLPAADRAPLLAALATLEADGKTGTPPRETIRRIVELLGAQARAGDVLDGEPAPRSTANSPRLDLSFDDELYIGNAGLVILWPFLGDFFAHLGLVEGKHFKDRDAQQRAVRLLQHIATGNEACPEYLLPLNKLLCGLELTEVFDAGEPLRESEIAACADLLRVTIEQAPILRDMSVAGFQGTFLLRQAVLSARDDSWLLRVERKAYDLVLDRFPWGWQWLKLPWMDAPLQVEW